MTDLELEQLKYPIGKLVYPKQISNTHIEAWIECLEYFPQRLEQLVKNLSDAQLDTPYRPEGWTVRQVVHHVSDSHLHSYIRFKWAMTEEHPKIKAYDEKAWSTLHDSEQPIDHSLVHLAMTHAKLVYFLKGLSSRDLERTYVHPEGNKVVSLKENLGMYAWHSQHHYAHIERLMLREGWR
ncbi:putative metal-dependent hydrolase [Lacinutrix neustonica]|uniref:Metal-dependent hydrolase n=1 Tax=Lacinutrix neustonica TaxID=2980107 RepID=A0A9E8MUV3_9FLAO|nr:putative metal-dependent hydrolase [Lacinutrix neustonica]WAC01978.1 putative metal-dependent hydrolase [Lacinutrix neustonica]